MEANDLMNEAIYEDFCTSKQILMQKQVESNPVSSNGDRICILETCISVQ